MVEPGNNDPGFRHWEILIAENHKHYHFFQYYHLLHPGYVSMALHEKRFRSLY